MIRMVRKIDMQVIGEMIDSDYLDDIKMSAFVEMIESIHKTFKQEQTTDHSDYGQYILVSGNDYRYEYVLRTWGCMELINAELY